jgi:hypothetical protein
MLAYCADVVDAYKALADPAWRTIVDELTLSDGKSFPIDS